MDITKLEKEIAKYNESFVSEVRGMTLSQIKDTLARESIRLQEIDLTMEKDEELADVKAQLKEIKAPYMDSKKKQRLLIQFLVVNLEEKTIKE